MLGRTRAVLIAVALLTLAATITGIQPSGAEGICTENDPICKQYALDQVRWGMTQAATAEDVDMMTGQDWGGWRPRAGDVLAVLTGDLHIDGGAIDQALLQAKRTAGFVPVPGVCGTSLCIGTTSEGDNDPDHPSNAWLIANNCSYWTRTQDGIAEARSCIRLYGEPSPSGDPDHSYYIVDGKGWGYDAKFDRVKVRTSDNSNVGFVTSWRPSGSDQPWGESLDWSFSCCGGPGSLSLSWKTYPGRTHYFGGDQIAHFSWMANDGYRSPKDQQMEASGGTELKLTKGEGTTFRVGTYLWYDGCNCG